MTPVTPLLMEQAKMRRQNSFNLSLYYRNVLKAGRMKARSETVQDLRVVQQLSNREVNASGTTEGIHPPSEYKTCLQIWQ